jgi:ubiquinone/menaquinone biosynthesis C-methylase UbiE
MNARLRQFAKDFCPPVAWRAVSRVRRALAPRPGTSRSDRQDIDVYWTPEMAALLEKWGEGNAWLEIDFLMANLKGRVLDIACGTGKVMALLERPGLEIYGCDISNMLIDKAVERGLAPDRLQECDATNLPYADGSFDYSYSIGSLEHFTDVGIDQFIAEAHRVTRVASFHMMPTSRSGRDEGWIKTLQSYHNSSVPWWVRRFEQRFASVKVLDSNWNDPLSVGKWFLCSK